MSQDNSSSAEDALTADAPDAPATGTIALPTSNVSDLDKLLFKHDRLYMHNILRINYTTYDVRRKQDTINPGTSHRDVIVMAETEDEGDHPYLYARVIGILHANVVYTGGTRVDYTPRKYEVLWVRWFEHDTTAPAGSWSHSRLDRLHFPPMARDDAFGFLDPADIVRGCHMIPAFTAGKRHEDGKGLSLCAMDSGDWRSYYVNRYVYLSQHCFNTEYFLLGSWTAICSCGTIGDLLLAMSIHISGNATIQGLSGLTPIRIFPPRMKDYSLTKRLWK